MIWTMVPTGLLLAFAGFALHSGHPWFSGVALAAAVVFVPFVKVGS